MPRFSPALGIGAAAAVSNWCNGILLNPYPAIRDSGQLVVLSSRAPAGATDTLSYPDFQTYRETASDLRDVVATAAAIQPLALTEDGTAESERVLGASQIQIITRRCDVDLVKRLVHLRRSKNETSRWRALRDGPGPHGLRFHDLRHTVITELAEMGVADHVLESIKWSRLPPACARLAPSPRCRAPRALLPPA